MNILMRISNIVQSERKVQLRVKRIRILSLNVNTCTHRVNEISERNQKSVCLEFREEKKIIKVAELPMFVTHIHLIRLDGN